MRASRKNVSSTSEPMIRRMYIDWAKVEAIDEYPFNIPAIKHSNDLMFDSPVTILVGENGTGKSTLLEAIAVQLKCNTEGGSRNFRFSTQDTLSSLYRYMRLVRGARHPRDAYFYRADTYYNLATEMRRLDATPSFDPEIKTYYGGKDLHELSHGQSVIRLLEYRFKPTGVYVMDEPEAALSPMRQLEAIAAIRRLSNEGAQFILATHSPIIMAIPGANIYELSMSGVVETSYERLQHVRLYRQFLEDPRSLLDRARDIS